MIDAVLAFFVTLAAAAPALAASGSQDVESWKLMATMAVGGALFGLGRLLTSSERLTYRLILGRAIVGGGLGVAAGSLLAFLPGLGIVPVCGFAAALSILGEQFLEKWLSAKTNT